MVVRLIAVILWSSHVSLPCQQQYDCTTALETGLSSWVNALTCCGKLLEFLRSYPLPHPIVCPVEMAGRIGAASAAGVSAEVHQSGRDHQKEC